MEQPPLALISASGFAGGDAEREVSTADIIVQVEALVREQLDIAKGAAPFTHVFVPDYEDSEVVDCGNRSGTHPDGWPIAPIVQLVPARRLTWGPGNSPHRVPPNVAVATAIRPRRPDHRSHPPRVPE